MRSRDYVFVASAFVLSFCITYCTPQHPAVAKCTATGQVVTYVAPARKVWM